MQVIQTAIKGKYPLATIIALIEEQFASEIITFTQYHKLMTKYDNTMSDGDTQF